VPYPIGSNPEFLLENAFRTVLERRTAGPEMRTQIAPFLLGDEARLEWIFDGETEPAAPFARIKKKSQSRFGNGLPVYRSDSAGRFLEEEWRVSLELVLGSSDATDRDQSAPSLDVIFSQIMREQFRFPAGRAELEALGIYHIHIIDEGEANSVNPFSIDCMTEVYFEMFTN
jgi:hypothetical protein